MDDPKFIDLPPSKWTSEREKPREPIFGSGALPFVGELLMMAGAIGLMILVIFLGIYAKEKLSFLLYGEPAAKTSVAPGSYTWDSVNGLQPKKPD